MRTADGIHPAITYSNPECLDVAAESTRGLVELRQVGRLRVRHPLILQVQGPMDMVQMGIRAGLRFRKRRPTERRILNIYTSAIGPVLFVARGKSQHITIHPSGLQQLAICESAPGLCSEVDDYVGLVHT